MDESWRIEAEHLRAEIVALTIERDKLMSLVVRPGSGPGDYLAYIPYRGDGYLDGTWLPERGCYGFTDGAAAVAAVRAAMDDGPGPAPRPPLSDTIRAIRAAGGDAWDKVGDVDAFLGREGDGPGRAEP